MLAIKSPVFIALIKDLFADSTIAHLVLHEGVEPFARQITTALRRQCNDIVRHCSKQQPSGVQKQHKKRLVIAVHAVDWNAITQS